jgi:hypothetical protein
MKTVTRTQISAVLTLAAAASLGCAGPRTATSFENTPVRAADVVIRSAEGTPRPPFRFAPDDAALLDEIAHATFDYFWHAVSPETGMVYDRTSSDVVSVAGVGFQLAALPIGVERGWVGRDEAADRARRILAALESEPSNRKAGLFYHFINPHDASARRVGRELVVSTVDSALLFSGMLVAGAYFGDDIRTTADRLFAQADWSFFLADPGPGGPPGIYLSLGWKPHADDLPTGDGELLPYYWLDSGDEHRLTTLLGVAAPKPGFRVPPETYWNLRRQLGRHENQGHVVYFPYSGALFTAFFAHLFIDYASLGVDNPAAHGATHRARVDWWENSRRLVHLHRDRAIQNPGSLPTLGPDAWGFSAGDGPDGYLVSQVFPDPVAMADARPGRDFSEYRPTDNWGGGVVAPYAAGASIMFEPDLAVSALRAARGVTGPGGAPGVWRGEWGFADAFRLDRQGRADWVAEDFVAISQGPLLLGIENARTGLVWQLFMSTPQVRSGLERAGLDPSDEPGD